MTDSSRRREPSSEDRTKDYDYSRLVEEEKHHYSKVEVTSRLTEGGRHAGDAWEYYWERIAEKISRTPFGDLPSFLRSRRRNWLQTILAGITAKLRSSQRRRGRLGEMARGILGLGTEELRILSVGSGYCGHEIILAESLQEGYVIECQDLNEDLFEQARRAASEKELNLRFKATDLNFSEIEPGAYDMILAHASIHHLINLEHALDEIANGLKPTGVFHWVDVIGENRRLLWEENERFISTLLDALPLDLTPGRGVVVTEDFDGMEGLRQAETYALVHERFVPLFELLHGAFMRHVCGDDPVVAVLSPDEPESRRYLDLLIDIDECCVARGVLRPLEVWGVYERRQSP